MLNDRLNHLGDYPFRRLTTLLSDIAPPPGLEPLLLSIGEPQLPPPSVIAETLVREQAGFSKYPPAAGSPAFRAAVAGFLKRRYGLPEGFLDIERGIVPAPGSRESLFLLGLAAIPQAKNGQRPAVLMPNPFYQVYAGSAIIGGAEPVFVDAPATNGFMPDLDALAPELLDRTAIFYLCSPSNPQGTIADLAYMKRLIALGRKHDFVVALDECYAEIYRDTPPAGGLQAALEMGEGTANLVVFHSLSKRSSSPGLRSGFVAGDPVIVSAMLRVMEYGGAGMPLPVQAAAAALWNDDAHVGPIRAIYNENFLLTEEILGNRFRRFTPTGGFFLWLDVGDGEALCRRLWEKSAIKTLPGRYLSRDQPDGSNPGTRYLRFALVHEPTITRTALTRVAEALKGVEA